MPAANSFLAELRNRGVVRAGLIYAAAAFATLEFAEIAFPRLGLPDGAVNAVLWLGLAGFPVVLVAAWAIEVRAEPDSASAKRWLSPATVATALAFVVLGAAIGLWWGGSDEPEAPVPGEPGPATPPLLEREPAVAVLRFLDPAETADHAYFAAGLSEEISTALSRFRGIRVIAPSATAALENSDGDALLRARESGIAFLLQGTVRRGETKVRVSAQLIDATNGTQVWGDNYDAALDTAELLDTQDRIAGRVASAVADFSGVIVRASQATARRRGSDRFEAYDCVLLGHAYLEIHTAEVHEAARDCLEKAVELDPDYADAWAHLSYMYREEYHHGFNGRPDPIARAEAAAQQAVELDAANPMLHFSMGQIYFSRREFAAGIAAWERAAALNPNDSVVRATLGT